MAKKEISRRDFLKGMAAGTVGVAAAGVLSACNYTLGDSKNLGKPKAAAPAAAKPTTPIYKPGTYTSSAKGIGSDVTVTMSFDEFSITDCSIVVSGETPDIGGKIGGDMEAAILAGQTADVDAVTGATVTSDAIRKAAAEHNEVCRIIRRASAAKPLPFPQKIHPVPLTGWVKHRKLPKATLRKNWRQKCLLSAAAPAAGLPR